MKTNIRYTVSWVTLGVVLLLGYLISFTNFVHAHQRGVMRGPRGQAVTMVIVSVPILLILSLAAMLAGCSRTESMSTTTDGFRSTIDE